MCPEFDQSLSGGLMDRRFYVTSGLHGSGSMLLSAMLSDGPRLHACVRGLLGNALITLPGECGKHPESSGFRRRLAAPLAVFRRFENGVFPRDSASNLRQAQVL